MVSMTSRSANSCEVAVIGAGPYGLSVAAHLKQADISTHVFGEPMSFWRHHMPKGMKLRSPWRATHISNPNRSLSLDRYACERGLDRNKLLPLEEFVAYGEWFQRHAVPDIDRRAVRLVEAADKGFRLTLADGEVFAADRVVVATGLINQDYRPDIFCNLPAELVTHTSQHADFSSFRGRHVAVIGRGQSACESAALLAEAGAMVEIISNGEIRWLGGSAAALTGRLRRVLESPSAVGPFPLNWLVELPALLHHLPPAWRELFSRRCLTAGATHWLKPRFEKVTCVAGRIVAGARPRSDRIVLEFDQRSRTFDHVVLGTGYRVDLRRLGILSSRLLANIVCINGSPSLDAGFESSVPGLHFVGSYAVKSFGPLMRFIAGTRFAACAVSRAVIRERGSYPVPKSARISAAMLPEATATLPP